MKHSVKTAGLMLAVAAAFLASQLRLALAQELGSRPITMIVGVAAGGATDVTARMVAQKMSQSVSVIVENKPGAFFEPAYRDSDKRRARRPYHFHDFSQHDRYPARQEELSLRYPQARAHYGSFGGPLHPHCP